MSRGIANKVFNSHHRYFIFMMIFSLLLFSKLNAQVTQTICLEDAIPKSYKVDWEENGGEGTAGSTYTWEILGGSYNALIQPITTSGNQIEIDWSTVPVGTYTLVVTETTQAGCFNQEELEVVLEDCECDTPVTVNIDDIEPICEGQTIQLSVEIINASTVQWSTDGDGSFDNNTSSTPVYTPGPDDILNGSVELSAFTEDPDGEGVCVAASDEVSIVINPLQQVDTNSVETEFCVGEIYTLPTTLDGISGLWEDENGVSVVEVDSSAENPALIYVFVPDAGQGCYESSPVNFEINGIQPTNFAAYVDENVCSPIEIPLVDDLPTSDDNGVEGTWASTDHGDDTYSFIFTPLDAACYDSYTFVITEDPPYPIEFAEYQNINICDLAEMPQLDTLETLDDNGNSGVWSQTTTGNVTTFTFAPSNFCFTSFAFTVTLFEPVASTFDFVPVSEVCDASELPDLDDLPGNSNQGVQGVWAVSDDGNGVYAYVFTPDDSCYLTYEFSVQLMAEVEVTFVDLPTSNVCAFEELPEVSNLPSTSEEGITGVWTQTDNGDDTYTYTFTVDAGQGCYVGTSFMVEIIENIEVTFVDLPTSDVCEISDLPEVSNLPNTSEEGVTGVWTQTDNEIGRASCRERV